MQLSLNPKQGKVLTSKATEILFGGAVSGGKSHLLRVLAVTFAISCPGIQIFIFRRLYKELILNHLNATNSLPDMLRPLTEAGLVTYNKTDGQFIFKNGSNIVLGHAQAIEDIKKYQGAEIQILLLDEATLFTEYQVRFLRSRVRLGTMAIPDQYKDKLPLIIYATNPRGPSHRYFKTNFVDHGDMVIHKALPEEGGMLRQFISAKLQDNVAMVRNDPDYADRVRGLGNDALVQSMLNGDWSVSDSRAFPNISPETHLLNVDGRDLPSGYKFARCYDYGWSSPSVCLWYAVSNGESIIMQDGSYKDIVAGSIIFFDEDHQRERLGVGLKLSVEEGAIRINRISSIYGGRIKPGPADTAIFSTDRNIKSIAKEFDDNGVTWLRANKAPGTRIQGLQLMNDMINETLKAFPERPCLYLTPKTALFMVDLCNIELDNKKLDDVDTNSPHDHSIDAARYGILHLQKEVRTQKITGY